jgi:hypothetical protein
MGDQFEPVEIACYGAAGYWGQAARKGTLMR